MSNKQIQHFNQLCGGMSMVPGRPDNMQNIDAINNSTGLYQKCWTCIKSECKDTDNCDISSCFKLTPRIMEQEMKKF